jgi:branched-chain amino acid aminotransferase
MSQPSLPSQPQDLLDSTLRSWQWAEPEFVAVETLPLADRGFRYGMSVFESLRLESGHLHFATTHWNRLLQSARSLGFPAPPDTARLQTLELCASLRGSWFVRWYLTAGDGPPLGPIAQTRLFLIAEPRLRTPPPPLSVCLQTAPFQSAFSGIKTGNYWPHIAALAQAKNRGFDECLLLNPTDRLQSAAFANLLVHFPGQGWVTPPCCDGARNGVGRAWLLAQGKAREQSIPRADLDQADALFLCNSWMGLAPVAQLEGRPLRLPPEIEVWSRQFDAAEGEATLL